MCRKTALPEIEHAKGENHTMCQSPKPGQEQRRGRLTPGCLLTHRRGPNLRGKDERACGARGGGREQRGEWGARVADLPDHPQQGRACRRGAEQPVKDASIFSVASDTEDVLRFPS